MRTFRTKAGKVIRKSPDAIEKITQRFQNLPVAVIGFPRGKATSAKYPDGTKLLDVAFANNYGVISNEGREQIPARPFMTLSSVNIANEMKTDIRKIVERIRWGNILTDDGLNILGAKAGAIMKRTIRDLDDPPNAPYTIQKKKSDNPLVDTGFLIQSVTWDIRDRKEIK